eukprot:sb/3461003/
MVNLIKKLSPNIKVAVMNCCSLRNKTHEIMEEAVWEGLDVIFVTETWLHANEKSLEREISEYGYSLVHKSRGSPGGGVGVIFREGINVTHPKKSKQLKSRETLEATISGKGLQRTTVAVVYSSPTRRQNHCFLEELEDFLLGFAERRGSMVVGDLNVHVERPEEKLTADFMGIIEDHGYIQRVQGPTHKDGGTLDLVICRNSEDAPGVSNIKITEKSFLPDHYQIEMGLHIGVANSKQRKLVVNRSLKNLDLEDLVERILQSDLIGGDFPENVEECVKLYNDTLLEFLNEIAPETSKLIPLKGKPAWYNLACEVAKRKRRKAERWYRLVLKNSWDVKELCDALKQRRQASNEASKIIRKARQDVFSTKIKDSKNNAAAFFKLTNYLMGRDKTPQEQPEGYDDQDLANRFAEFFQEKVERISADIEDEAEKLGDQVKKLQYPRTLNCEFKEFSPLSEESLRSLVRDMSHKACDLDPMPTSFVTKLLPELSPVITTVVNKSLANGEFPTALKIAQIRPSYKQDDKNDLKNYRPVSNLPFLSKIVEKAVALQLTEYLENNKLLPSIQSAYRKGHSVETATTKILDDLLVITDKKSKAVLLLLDLSAAFDTIDHGRLISRLERDYGITGIALRGFSSYLSGRKASVKVGGATATPREVRIGVPQGSILGPLLFVMYTRELEEIGKKHGVLLHLYADDSQVYCEFKPADFAATETRIELCLEEIRIWMVHNRLASFAKVVPTENNGSTVMCKINRRTKKSGESELWLEFHQTKYICTDNLNFNPVAFPTSGPISDYTGSRGLSDDDVVEAVQQWGYNEMKIVLPSFQELFVERATAPFFVFQVFCVGLWCLDEYCVYRNKRWDKVRCNELCPGDLISLTRREESVPCDVILLHGSCVVNESMLTGESVPLMKESMVADDGSCEYEGGVLNLEHHSRLHVVFGGTSLVQHTASTNKQFIKAPDNGCIAYVLRTGFNTSQGKLLRTIMYSVKRVTANNFETFLFILFLLQFAIAASAYVWIEVAKRKFLIKLKKSISDKINTQLALFDPASPRPVSKIKIEFEQNNTQPREQHSLPPYTNSTSGTKDPDRNRYKLFLECTLILTSVVPPELPIELSLAVNNSLISLIKMGVCGVKKGDPSALVPVEDAPLGSCQVLATCHSLLHIDGQLIGDPIERATLSVLPWNLTKGDVVICKSVKQSLKIMRRFHFNSTLKRMSVVVSQQDNNYNVEYFVMTKGAPEVIKTMLAKVPESYDETHKQYTLQGGRVIALAKRPLGKDVTVRDLQREDAEKDLEFCGFVVFSTPLKKESKAAVTMLRDSSHYIVMITGDSPLTACYVANQLRISKKNLILIEKGKILIFSGISIISWR